MSFVLFIDESGHDLRNSPYEVLAGIAIEDSRIWNLITALQDAEVHYFGGRITDGDLELKAKKLLKTKTFRLARQLEPLPMDERTALVKECLVEGRAAKAEQRDARVSKRQLTALAQAKVAFVERVFELCAQHQVRAFASVVDRDAPRPQGGFLRKDYSYLFERYYYYLDEQRPYHHGLVVFDELEHSRSHILLDQMGWYFKRTATGRLRASRIVPEPFFVHSELSSLIQVADLVAYVIAWGVRVGTMDRPAREELKGLAGRVSSLRLRFERDGQPFPVWSFAIIDDLRPRDERAEPQI